MKKFCFFILILLTFSCSTDSAVTTSEPTLLQRVDFYPGLASERRWFFTTDGLLSQITKADGTVLQHFTYDASNRLISATLNDNGINETHTFTYDNANFVATVDGVTVNYDSALGAYYTGDLSQAYRLTKINSDKLLIEGKTVVTETDETGTNTTEWYVMHTYYSNNNLTGYSYMDGCNSLTYDSNTNPLRNATLPICRAFSFIDNQLWINGQYSSVNNVLSHNYCAEDPESSIFHYTYNTNNLPATQTKDNYYLGYYENTTASANYYYQGDVIP